MPIKINYNICDNAKECSGVAVCPTGALYWDEKRENYTGEEGTLCVDNSKCISCGNCVGENGCPIGAIFFAETEDELDKMTKDYQPDIDQIEELFVERYGAAPIDNALCVEENELAKLIQDNQGILLVEEFCDESIQCLLCAIPIDIISHDIQMITGIDDVHFYRLDRSKETQEAMNLPRLQIYNGNRLVGVVEGFYSTDQVEELKGKIKEMFRR